MPRTRKKSGTVKKQRPRKVKRTKRLNKNIAGGGKSPKDRLQELKSTLRLLKGEGDPRTVEMREEIENKIKELERQIELPPEPMPGRLRKSKSPSIKSLISLQKELQELKSTLKLLKKEGNPDTDKMEKDIKKLKLQIKRQKPPPPESMPPGRFRRSKSPRSHHAEETFSLIITDFDNPSVTKTVDGLKNKDTIRWLKGELRFVENIELIYNGIVLEDKDTLESYMLREARAASPIDRRLPPPSPEEILYYKIGELSKSDKSKLEQMRTQVEPEPGMSPIRTSPRTRHSSRRSRHSTPRTRHSSPRTRHSSPGSPEDEFKTIKIIEQGMEKTKGKKGKFNLYLNINKTSIKDLKARLFETPRAFKLGDNLEEIILYKKIVGSGSNVREYYKKLDDTEMISEKYEYIVEFKEKASRGSTRKKRKHKKTKNKKKRTRRK